MSKRIPSLVWLRAFEASARHLSFTLAASELGLTQTAVSKQVKNLEHHFGELLFQRRARSLVLTKAGEAYLPKVKDAFDRLAVGTEEVFGQRKAELLTLRVSVGFSALWLGPRLGAFRQKHPDIGLRVVSTVWNTEIDESDVDLEVRYGVGDWDGFSAERLTSEKLFPVCHPDLLQGENALRAPEDLKNHTLLHVDGYEEGWAIWLKSAGITSESSVHGIHFDTSIVSFEMAASGHGVALGRSSIANHVLGKGNLVAPFDLFVTVKEGFFLLTPKIISPHPHAQIFSEWLLEQAKASKT